MEYQMAKVKRTSRDPTSHHGELSKLNREDVVDQRPGFSPWRGIIESVITVDCKGLYRAPNGHIETGQRSSHYGELFKLNRVDVMDQRPGLSPSRGTIESTTTEDCRGLYRALNGHIETGQRRSDSSLWRVVQIEPS